MDKRVVAQIELHLKNFKAYQSAIKNLGRQLENEYVISVTSIKSMPMSSKNISAPSTVESSFFKREKLQDQIKEYQLMVDSIECAVDRLSPDEKQFVKLRYFEKHSVVYISDKMMYSPRSINRLRNKVLQQLQIMLSSLSMTETS